MANNNGNGAPRNGNGAPPLGNGNGKNGNGKGKGMGMLTKENLVNYGVPFGVGVLACYVINAYRQK